MVGRTRIHVDRVAELGTFLELEVVLGERDPEEAGIVEARQIMRRLGVRSEHLIDRAYLDLLSEARG